MKKLLTLFLLLLPFITNARKFYFSTSGSDSYTTTQAQSPNTPWQTLRKITTLTTGTNGSSVFKPGDTILFKRGDVFANGQANGYCSAFWWNDGGTYWTAPSGTPAQPIVISNYGDPNLPLPNWLYPSATYPVSTWKSRESRGVIEFAGVSNIIIDGIQSNDIRQPEVDKKNPSFTGGWIIGEWSNSRTVNNVVVQGSNNPANRKNMVTNFIVRNCVFNNVSYGLQQFAGINSKIINCKFTNLKSTADTSGVNDVMAGGIEALYGFNNEISGNFFKGCWAKSGRISSTSGVGGVAMDIFNLKNSRICYNTFIDCGGVFEIGNLDRLDSNSGAQYDTFAFNKIINSSQFGYLHGSTGSFIGNNHHLAFWNNVIISNNKDRHNGPGYGDDLYNDGQGFSQQFWFFRSKFNTLNVAPMGPTANTTRGSNVITVSSNSGIRIGSVAFANNDTILGIQYKTVTVTAINGTSITLSDTILSTRTATGAIDFYLPVSDTTWSNPTNSAMANYGGVRFLFQYASDNTTYGSYIDTMIDCRNNVVYWTTGVQAVYDRNRYKRISNLYYPRGGMRYTTTLGGTLKTNEKQFTTGKLFKDTSSVFPENWDISLTDSVHSNTIATRIQGFTKDFAGFPIGGTPFIGIYKPVIGPPPPTPCNFTYGNWTDCVNGSQTRPYTSSPSGCIGTPPQDSIQRTCVIPCNFEYVSWGPCINGFQYRDYVSYPDSCVGIPPQDSIQRACNNIVITKFYYDPLRIAIYIESNVSGQMMITDILGSYVRRFNYRPNGQWIGIRNFPRGVCFASTNGQTITFIR
jgi:hypothetical protein